MTVFIQRLFAVMLLVLAASQASATTFRYDLTFKDEGGTVIGNGVARYNPTVKEDLYWNPIQEMGARCINASDQFCEYQHTWTPLTELHAVIDGTDILAAGTNTEVWLEGSYVDTGRGGAGYWAGSWVVSTSNSASVFITTAPPSGADFFETDFDFSYDYYRNELRGTLEMSLVPVPPSLASLGLGLLMLAGWRRVKG